MIPPNQDNGPEPAAVLIAAECDALKALLLAKNAAYGNSALDPVRIFSRASPEEQILVRLDDKLSRLARGAGVENEDVLLDILGYIILLRVARKGKIEPGAEMDLADPLCTASPQRPGEDTFHEWDSSTWLCRWCGVRRPRSA